MVCNAIVSCSGCNAHGRQDAEPAREAFDRTSPLFAWGILHRGSLLGIFRGRGARLKRFALLQLFFFFLFLGEVFLAFLVLIIRLGQFAILFS